MSWTRSPATCSPKPLPAAASADSSQYARVAPFPLTFQLTFNVVDNDSTISLTPTSATGTTSFLALSGTLIRATHSAILTRAGTQVEGPRADGHTFVVNETGADTAQFINLVQSPPGNQIEVHFTANGAGTATFREGGVAGPIFSTCTFVDTIRGSKLVDQ